MNAVTPFNPDAEAFLDDVPRIGAYRCHEKLPYVHESEVRFRSCGRCKGCIARDKRDRSSRGSGEAQVAAEIIGLTLTYRPNYLPGEPGLHRFEVEEIQLMMDRLRFVVRELARKRLEAERLKRVEAALVKDPSGLSVPFIDMLPFTRRKMTPEQKLLLKEATPKLFYIRVGERGERFGRRHWHVAVFADKATGIAESLREPIRKDPRGRPLERRGQLIREERPEIWPHGFATVDVFAGGSPQVVQETFTPAQLIQMGREGYRPPAVDPELGVRLSQYLHKYIEKTRGVTLADKRRGDQAEVVYGCSNARPMGMVWIEQEARRMARAGLPWNGIYDVPGVTFSHPGKSRGPKDQRAWSDKLLAPRSASELEKLVKSDWVASAPLKRKQNCVFGAARLHSILAYEEEWRKGRPGRKMPLTEFIKWYHPDRDPDEYVQPAKVDMGWLAHSVEAPAVLPAQRDPARAGTLVLFPSRHHGGGSVECYPTGVGRFYPTDERLKPVWLPRGDLSDKLPMLTQRERTQVEDWLLRKRGSDWLTPLEWRAAAFALVKRRDEAIARFSKPSIAAIPDRADLPVIESETGTRRRMRLKGNGHAKRIVRAMASGKLIERSKSPNFGLRLYDGYRGDAP